MPHSEADFLAQYNPENYARPSTCVDTVIFTVCQERLHVLLVQRAAHPCRDQWALVGGFIDPARDQTLEDTAKRKLWEKTGVDTPYLEQCVTIGNAHRDPRGWSVTTVYFALLPFDKIILRPDSGAKDSQWHPIGPNGLAQNLAFDHNLLFNIALERLRNKVLYTTLPAWLMPEKFTLGDLQKAHEIILDHPIETKSFRRRIEHANILEETSETRQDAKRPARLYRLRPDTHTHFFVRTIAHLT